MNSAVNIHVSRNSSTNYLRLSKTAEVMSEYIVLVSKRQKNNISTRHWVGPKIKSKRFSSVALIYLRASGLFFFLCCTRIM